MPVITRIIVVMKYQLGSRVQPPQIRLKLLGATVVSLLLALGLIYKGSAVTWASIPIIGSKKNPANTQQSSSSSKQSTGSTHNSAAINSKSRSSQPTGASTTANSVNRVTACNSGQPKHASLASASVSQLRSLEKFESVCGSAITNTLSFFVPTPISSTQAKEYAGDTATILKEYARFAIHPFVYMEPTNNGGILNLQDYSNGQFDSALDSYFKELRVLGITDSSMGTWVPFPEGNIPVWNNVEPNLYATNVTKTVQIMKKHFPGAKTGLLLDSATYPSGSSWSGSRYVSLTPYIQNIPKGLIDTIGLQGFPWTPPATSKEKPAFDPNAYLQINELAEAARLLGTNSVWFNTGTFDRAYASSPTKVVRVTASQRQAMLDGTIALAGTLKRQGFDISIHLFAEDKSQTAEGIDWSYWQNDETTAVFKNFAHDAQAAQISLWLFDS